MRFIFRRVKYVSQTKQYSANSRTRNSNIVMCLQFYAKKDIIHQTEDEWRHWPNGWDEASVDVGSHGKIKRKYNDILYAKVYAHVYYNPEQIHTFEFFIYDDVLWYPASFTAAQALNRLKDIVKCWGTNRSTCVVHVCQRSKFSCQFQNEQITDNKWPWC